MITKEDVVTEARKWIGTPYHHQGRLRGIGVDCIGLLFGVGAKLGIRNRDKDSYKRYRRRPPKGAGMLLDLDETCGARIDDPQSGDIAVFWMNASSKRAQHIAIVSDRGLIHTHSRVGKVVEHRFSDWWRERLICGYRFPEVG